MFELYFENPREKKESWVFRSSSFNEVRKEAYRIVRDNEKADPFTKTFARLWKWKAGYCHMMEQNTFYARRGWYLAIRRIA